MNAIFVQGMDTANDDIIYRMQQSLIEMSQEMRAQGQELHRLRERNTRLEERNTRLEDRVSLLENARATPHDQSPEERKGT